MISFSGINSTSYNKPLLESSYASGSEEMISFSGINSTTNHYKKAHMHLSGSLHTVWSESLLCTHSPAKISSYLHMQTLIRIGRCPSCLVSLLGMQSQIQYSVILWPPIFIIKNLQTNYNKNLSTLKKTKNWFWRLKLSLNASQKYCRMLQGEHSAMLSTFIKLLFVVKTLVLSIFEWPFYTGPFSYNFFVKLSI